MPARYYGSSGAYASGGERSKAAGYRRRQSPSRYYSSEQRAKRQEAAPIVATGQFSPGALSRADARTTTTSVGTPNVTRFTSLPSGGVGTLVDRTDPYIALSPGFAEKAATSGVSVSLNSQGMPIITPGQNIEGFGGMEGVSLDPTQSTGGSGIENMRNAIYGQPGVPSDIMTGQSMMTPTPEQTRNWVESAFDTVSENFGFQLYHEFGIQSKWYVPGDHEQTFASMGLGGNLINNAIKGLTTGQIVKTGLKGGAKAWDTIKRMVTNSLTKQNVKTWVNQKGVQQQLPVVDAFGNAVRSFRIDPFKVLKAAGWMSVIGMGLYISGKGSQATGKRDVQEELGGYLSMVARDMYRDGNIEQGNAFMDILEGLSGDNISAMPGGLGVAQGADQWLETVKETAPMVRDHYNTMAEMQVEGMTPEESSDFWLVHNEKKLAQEEASAKRITEIYEQQRILAEYNARESARLEREDSAKFWLEYRKKLLKMEEEAREAQAKFWLEYRKLIAKIQAENQRSTLGFGLL